jgi:hypothetical protein
MNKANLKSYAPQARKDFIAAVTARANQLGLSFKAGSLEVAPAQTQGDVTVIAGQAWPSKVSGQRDKLIERIRKDGFEHTMDAVAYTWFNRFAALRYMELHDYMGHGHRALSSTAGGLPDILTHATDLSNDLPGLNAAKVAELKLAGNRDGELYRMLLVAQCNALSRAMPFLFERIDDDSELLLPDNLLRSDSVIAKLVAEIPEEDWAEVEIIGWLYQFYISEKKDQVIGKVVKSEDIPAATQLFTPNWIVQYLVQNSVGRLWLMANPQSTLAKEWPYYITPAEQTPEVQAQLDALIQTRVREDGDTLNPESITVLDPACGSGHILVVAYDVLKAIYLERGYQPRAIPRLILEKNLYGLDIDDRAAQMACFALLMKARADDRRLFTATDDAGNLQPPKLNVLSLQESKGLSIDELATHLAPYKVQRATITALIETFEHAKTFGSLIQIPYVLKTHLKDFPKVLASVQQSGDMYAIAAAIDLLPLVHQANVLAMQFDAVVANPPYMGIRKMPELLRDYFQTYKAVKHQDIYSAFIERFSAATRESGAFAAVTLHGWLQYSSFQDLRRWFTEQAVIDVCVHLGSRVFEELSGEVVQVAAFIAIKINSKNHRPKFIYLGNIPPEEKPSQVQNKELVRSTYTSGDYSEMPHGIYAFNMPRVLFERFQTGPSIGSQLLVRQGLATTDDGKYLRYWFELPFREIAFGHTSPSSGNSSGQHWFPFNKGGGYRKWYGNWEHVIRYENDGNDLLALVKGKYPKISDPEFVIKNRGFYCLPGVTWSNVSGGASAFRLQPQGVIFGSKGSCLFAGKEVLEETSSKLLGVLALMNSVVSRQMIDVITAGVDLNVKQIESIPITEKSLSIGANLAQSAVSIAKQDWDSFETSWDFLNLDFVNTKRSSIADAWLLWAEACVSRREEMTSIEVKNNAIFIDEYELNDQISSEVLESDITLAKPDPEKDSQRLISYAIGCMMGRYSLDEPGLIYAHAGNAGFEPGRYATYPADSDGIIPITDELWFADDAPSRIREFLRAVWGPDTLEENMAWLAESLGTKASETPDETIRRYIADKFFKDHLQTYKKRPIYWLFSSGKQGAFQALVYLHRYSEGTLSRLRAEYVVPLTGKIQSRIEMLQKDAAAASSTAARNKLAKEVEKLKKKHAELLAYDEQLRHYADMRITLDLDDGVKVNYGKFGDLLAETKAITGGASDD